MPGIFGNNVLKCSPLVYNSGTGVLPFFGTYFRISTVPRSGTGVLLFLVFCSTYFGIKTWCTPNRDW